MARKNEDIYNAAQEDYARQTSYDLGFDRRAGFMAGAKWMRKRMYTEDEVLLLLDTLENEAKMFAQNRRHNLVDFKEVFEQKTKKIF